MRKALTIRNAVALFFAQADANLLEVGVNIGYSNRLEDCDVPSFEVYLIEPNPAIDRDNKAAPMPSR